MRFVEPIRRRKIWWILHFLNTATGLLCIHTRNYTEPEPIETETTVWSTFWISIRDESFEQFFFRSFSLALYVVQHIHSHTVSIVHFVCSFSHGISDNTKYNAWKNMVTAPRSECATRTSFQSTRTICHTQTLLSLSLIHPKWRQWSHNEWRVGEAASVRWPR